MIRGYDIKLSNSREISIYAQDGEIRCESYWRHGCEATWVDTQILVEDALRFIKLFDSSGSDDEFLFTAEGQPDLMVDYHRFGLVVSAICKVMKQLGITTKRAPEPGD